MGLHGAGCVDLWNANELFNSEPSRGTCKEGWGIKGLEKPLKRKSEFTQGIEPCSTWNTDNMVVYLSTGEDLWKRARARKKVAVIRKGIF